jgi:CBS domain-containing protein
MNAYDLCQRNVVTVRPDEDLATAAWIMRERHVPCLVVVESVAQGGWRPVGMLSDRDIVTKVIACDCDPRSVVTADAMTPIVSVRVGITARDAWQRMRAARVRRVVMLDERGRLAGILALDDLFDRIESHANPPPARLHQPGSIGTERI